ncbi:MAG TPA: hypothetical protein VID51_07120 [Solirubrobacterales bacterium]|jgi:hypothetical protein
MASVASRRSSKQLPRREDLSGLTKRAAIFVALVVVVRLLAGCLDTPVIIGLIAAVFGPALPRDFIRIG